VVRKALTQKSYTLVLISGLCGTEGIYRPP